MKDSIYEAAKKLAESFSGDGREAVLRDVPVDGAAGAIVDLEDFSEDVDHHARLDSVAASMEASGVYLLCVKNPAKIDRAPMMHGGPWSDPAHYEAVLRSRFASVRVYSLKGDAFVSGPDAHSDHFAFVCRRPRPLRRRPKASIVMPLFNRAPYTAQALQALAANTPEDFELVPVDNGSTDETRGLLKGLSGDVLAHRNPENLGFAKACNQGALIARGEYVVFLNNDTEVRPGWLSALLDELARYPETGVAGGRLLYPDGTVQHAGVAVGRDQIPLHVNRGLAGDDPLVMERREFPVITGACMAVRRDEFMHIGMFDEAFVNGHEDIDLCLRYTRAGKRMMYRPDCVVVHHESVSEGRMDSRKANLARTMNKWRYTLEQDDFKYALRLADRKTPERALRFAVKIGVPDRRVSNWGDTYFAECLAKAIYRAGHSCRIDYLDQWGRDDLDVDVVIHVAGLSHYEPKPWNVNLMWMINHPELHGPERLARYDAVMVASRPYAEALAQRIETPVIELLQATDPDRFKPAAGVGKQSGVLFVGNNYSRGCGGDRENVGLLANSGVDMAVWGDDWGGVVPPRAWKGRFLDWADLPVAYSSAKVVLNDHQPEMREYGFINNRTFDAAACGAVVLSDAVQGLRDVVEGVETADSADALIAKARELLANPEDTAEKAARLRRQVLDGHTFGHRVQTIEALLANLGPAFDRAAQAGTRALDFRSDGPLVSVLMSTYNRPAYLPDAIRSVLAQSYANLELVLVNDGGEDVSGIVRAMDDPRIVYLHLPERNGKARAINTAFAASRGEFIAHLDDDDAWYPDHLDSLLTPLLNINGLRMAYSDAWRVTLEPDDTGELREVLREMIYHHQVHIGYLLENNYITGISVCHDRALFEEAGGMDERLSVLIDWDLWRRFAALTDPYHVSRATAEYYIRGGKKTDGEGHITNLHVSDHPRYMMHRALIINKRLPLPEGSPYLEQLPAIRRRSRADFLHARADGFAEKGDVARAEKLLERACRVDSEEAYPYRKFGDFCFGREDIAKALALYKTAMKKDSAQEVDYLNTALALVRLGRKREAHQCLRTVSEQFKPEPEVQALIERFIKRFFQDQTEEALAVSSDSL